MERLISGKLYHVVGFRVTDISMEGLQLLSSFEPTVGELYTIYLQSGEEAKKFQIQITWAKLDRFLPEDEAGFKAGPLFSIGARFAQRDDELKAFLLSLARLNAEELKAGFIDEKKPDM